MNSDTDSNQEKDSTPDNTPVSDNPKPGRQSFRRGRMTRQADLAANETVNARNQDGSALASSNTVKEVYIDTVPAKELAPINDNLAELRVPAGVKKNGVLEHDSAGNEWQEATFKGRRPGDRYIRFSRSSSALEAGLSFNRDRLLYKNAPSAEPRTGFGRLWRRTKRLLIGRPLPSSEAIHQRLSKMQALAVLSSDALSSTAYGTEQILLVLAAAAAADLGLVIPLSLGIALLIMIVSLSYRQTIFAYPLGGGSYIVAKDNLGVNAGLIAAASLMIDYVLTVAVSITAGVAAIISAIPTLQPWTVEICLVFLAFIAIANLRGVRESGMIFTAPTYIFIFSMCMMLLFGFLNWFGIVVFQPEVWEVQPIQQAETMSVFILLRAFASGCTALTGIEAVSDGVPAFKRPESKNAATTLMWMASILLFIFVGISLLANHFGIHPLEEGKPGYETVVSMVARRSVGESPLYFLIQAATALILVLAANTAFSDFPRLSWFLARDKFLPHLFSHKGDRLAFSTGIITLALLAALLIIFSGGQTDALIPLYAVGVFNSFTLSQSGMVRRWWRLRTPGWQRSMLFNGLGAILTFIVLIVIAATKFLEGAWLVVLLIPCIFMMFRLIHRHYEHFRQQVTRGDTGDQPLNMANHTVMVPVNDLNPITRRTLTYARSLGDNVLAVHVNDDPERIAELRQCWDEAGMDIPLVVIETPYRAILGPLLAYIDSLHKREPDETITVVIPEFITAKWWQQLLHNQTAFRLKAALLIRPGVVVTSVPYHLRQ